MTDSAGVQLVANLPDPMASGDNAVYGVARDELGVQYMLRLRVARQ